MRHKLRAQYPWWKRRKEEGKPPGGALRLQLIAYFFVTAANVNGAFCKPLNTIGAAAERVHLYWWVCWLAGLAECARGQAGAPFGADLIEANNGIYRSHFDNVSTIAQCAIGWWGWCQHKLLSRRRPCMKINKERKSWSISNWETSFPKQAQVTVLVINSFVRSFMSAVEP